MATEILTGAGDPLYTDPFGYRSAESTFAFYGTFGGGTVTVEASFDNGTIWIPLKKASGDVLEITSNEIHTIVLGKCLMRFKIAGATNPTVNITITD